MAEIDDQRKRVEELKRKILEQKKAGGETPSSEAPVSKPLSDLKEQGIPAAPGSEIKQVTIQAEEVHKSEKSAIQQKVIEKAGTSGENKSPVSQAIPVVSLQAYAQVLKQAWSNGSVSEDEQNLLLTLRKSMGISDEVHQSLEQEIRFEIYYSALVDCWKDGSLTTQELDTLELLREKFHISAEEHLQLEKRVRQEIGKH
jgi:hypothetical protein